ncbi:MAG: hypothetical protein P4L84_07720 [Isosphaeraceae bacterium]|nr:hypothetical protein [Isosphaeraceae bacterium]
MPNASAPARALPRWLAYCMIFGLYLTLRGYHSRDNDQAYRLPILLHHQDPALFANDPFVRAFDAFNPHTGSLTLLDWASRPLGLSTGLFALFTGTFLATVWGVDHLARTVWPEAGPRVGLAAVALVLLAKAGNVGTNHLFEAMLLDRLMAYALGWVALAVTVERPQRGLAVAPLLIGLAALIHPSLGLQLALVLAASWVVWTLIVPGPSYGVRELIVGLAWLALALLPGMLLNMGQGGRLLEGLPPDEFRLLSVELQGPQHMLPHLWRKPQWLAWGCYLVLAALAWVERDRKDGSEAARTRLMIVLAVTLSGLGAAWFGVEVVRDLRITLFQPFRMATLARGLALVLASGRAVALWRRGRFIDRARVMLAALGLAGDWALVVATLFDVTVALLERVRLPVKAWESIGADQPARPMLRNSVLAAAVLATGLWFLARHDTESGHIPLLSGLALVPFVMLGPRLVWNGRRIAFALSAVWTLPVLSLLVAPHVETGHAPAWQVALVERCRFRATAVDDVERLAVWCRDHTPRGARFIGPPGPKTFRLWSERNVAFNRAASPYQAAALGDWFRRFQDHVGDHSPPAEFVRAYQTDRHGLEQRYHALGDAEHAALARRQGAGFVIAAPPKYSDRKGPLELLHVEGRYAVYRVRPEAATLAASAGTG